MRVLFVINALGRGGAERVCVDDANALVASGHDVHVALLYRPRDQQELLSELDTRVHVCMLEAHGPFDLSALATLRRYIRGQHISAVLSTLNDANIVARFAVMFSRARLVMREANDPERKTWWQRLLDVALSSVPAAVIVVTDDTRRKVLRSLPWMRAKTSVLHNAAPAVETSTHEPQPEPTFLFVGRFDEQKDPLTAVRAFAMASNTTPSRLRMIGEGSLIDAARSIAQELQVQDRVTFCGALPHADVVREMLRADALVLSSRWEGCPNVVLEAMAVGTPIVATRVGGVPELLDDASGILVPPSDARALGEGMLRIAQDPIGARALASAAQDRAREMFSREARLTRLIGILSLE